MSRLFPDPRQPLATRLSSDRDGCPLQSGVHCHFTARDLAGFLVFALPPFVLGGAGLFRVSPWWLLPWVALAVSYFGVIEIRVMCLHCLHYAEPGTRSLQCWANYGSPKLWKYRPGSMSPGERLVFIAGLVLVAGYPAAFLVVTAQWFLLALFAPLIFALGVRMRLVMCNLCMNVACPLNCVKPQVWAMFFARNRGIARAWMPAGRGSD